MANEAALLQQVLLDPGALDRARRREVDVDVFAEPRAVVVPDRLGVAKRCKQNSKKKKNEFRKWENK